MDKESRKFVADSKRIAPRSEKKLFAKKLQGLPERGKASCMVVHVLPERQAAFKTCSEIRSRDAEKGLEKWAQTGADDLGIRLADFRRKKKKIEYLLK